MQPCCDFRPQVSVDFAEARQSFERICDDDATRIGHITPQQNYSAHSLPIVQNQSGQELSHMPTYFLRRGRFSKLKYRHAERREPFWPAGARLLDSVSTSHSDPRIFVRQAFHQIREDGRRRRRKLRHLVGETY